MSNSSSDASPRLQYFPATFFASVMGLVGLTLSWRAADPHFHLPFNLEWPLLVLSSLVFVALAVIYLSKWLRHPEAVKAEFNHPIKLSFFPTFSISLILLSAAWMPMQALVGQALFWSGIVLHLILTLLIIGAWVKQDKFQIQHINPSWFIPVVGNILVPIVAVPLGQVEVAWFYFSIGLVFWLVLMTIFFYRIIFHNPLPPVLIPTFFILLAPPAVGFIAYLKLNPRLDTLAQILFGFALFLCLFLLMHFRWFRGLPFALSWWAFSFPTAAMTIAAFTMYSATNWFVYQGIAMLLFALVNVLIASLFIRTLLEIKRCNICLPDS